MYKKIFEGKKAFIFDLDGTIVKGTEELRNQAIKSVLKESGYGYMDPTPYCMEGYGIQYIWEAFIKGNDIKDIKSRDAVEKTLTTLSNLIKEAQLELTNGFWDLMYEIKNERKLKTALVTNSYKTTHEQLINKLDIQDIFDLILFGDDVKKLKPNEEIYKKTLRKLGVPARNTIAFEDSIPGVKAAGKAGIDTIVIWNSNTYKNSYKGKIVDFTEDLSNYSDKFHESHLEYISRRFKENQPK